MLNIVSRLKYTKGSLEQHINILFCSNTHILVNKNDIDVIAFDKSLKSILNFAYCCIYEHHDAALIYIINTRIII